MSRPIHFEIQAADTARAQTFYRELFGWTFKQWGGQEYWVITTGAPPAPGIDGGLMPRRGAAPIDGQAVNAFVCTVDVDNLEAKLKQAVNLGGTLAVPTMPIPTIGWLAYVKDTEGNLVGLMQQDPNAK